MSQNPEPKVPGQELMNSTEMRVILSSTECEMRDIHQSPDNSPPPSPPKEMLDESNESIHDDDLAGNENNLTLKRSKAQPLLLNSNMGNTHEVNDCDNQLNGHTVVDEEEALKVLQLQKNSEHVTGQRIEE